MAIASLNADLLQPQVLTKVVSRVAATHNELLDMFLMGPGQSKSIHMGEGRNGLYHVYNNSRKVARGTSPGGAANRRPAQEMAAVPFVFPRIFDSVALHAEMLHNLGRIDDPRKRDEAGEQMIKRQATTLGQILSNWRTAMLGGLLRGKIYGLMQGDAVIWDYEQPGSGQYFEIPWARPAGNTAKLNMLGAGNILATSWASAAAPIPDDLGQINAAFQQLYGGRLEHVLCNWKIWNYVIQNEAVANTHGSVNQPFVVFDREEKAGPDGKKINSHKARLNVMPNVVWHVSDAGLELGPANTYRKHIPENYACFLGFDPATDEVCEMREGSEPIAEYDGGPISIRAGAYSFATQKANPTATELFILDNALPVIYNPAAIALGECVF
jgi:hypothetical protein